MNFLILSAGRRTKLVEYFMKEFKRFGKIIATDCDSLAPALYVADKGYIVPKIDSKNYIDKIKEIDKAAPSKDETVVNHIDCLIKELQEFRNEIAED